MTIIFVASCWSQLSNFPLEQRQWTSITVERIQLNKYYEKLYFCFPSRLSSDRYMGSNSGACTQLPWLFCGSDFTFNPTQLHFCDSENISHKSEHRDNFRRQPECIFGRIHYIWIVFCLHRFEVFVRIQFLSHVTKAEFQSRSIFIKSRYYSSCFYHYVLLL